MAKRGGARAGAGRPKGSVNLHRKMGREIALEALERANLPALLDSFLNCADMKIRMECAKFLLDHAWGKAAQTVDQTISNPDGTPMNQGIKIIAVMPDNKQVEIPGPLVEEQSSKNKVHKVM